MPRSDGGWSRDASIAGQVVVTEGGAHEPIHPIFTKLRLSTNDGSDGRVATVLQFLES